MRGKRKRPESGRERLRRELAKDGFILFDATERREVTGLKVETRKRAGKRKEGKLGKR